MKESKKKNKSKKKDIAFSPRQLKITIVAELLFIFVLLMIFPFVTSWYSDNPARIDSDNANNITDDISAGSGSLNINNITVKVPDDGNVGYDISYSWSEDDKDYPSIPRAITASYKSGNSEDAAVLYDISLYRNSYTESSRVKPGMNSDNWFDDWAEQDNTESTQSKLKSGDINGFCISTLKQAGDNGLDDGSYGTYSYYFASPLKKGIAVYVIEGICYDKDSADEMKKVLDESIDSIKIKSDTIGKKTD